MDEFSVGRTAMSASEESTVCQIANDFLEWRDANEFLDGEMFGKFTKA